MKSPCPECAANSVWIALGRSEAPARPPRVLVAVPNLRPYMARENRRRASRSSPTRHQQAATAQTAVTVVVVSSDPNHWLLGFYAKLRSHHAFATFAPFIQFEQLAQAVEREHPAKGRSDARVVRDCTAH